MVTLYTSTSLGYYRVHGNIYTVTTGMLGDKFPHHNSLFLISLLNIKLMIVCMYISLFNTDQIPLYTENGSLKCVYLYTRIILVVFCSQMFRTFMESNCYREIKAKQVRQIK